jgi:hypothetical protein
MSDGDIIETGYAVVMNGMLLPRTVCETKRGAMVNWLMTYRQVIVFSQESDDEIEKRFYEYAKTQNAAVHEIEMMTTSGPLEIWHG